MNNLKHIFSIQVPRSVSSNICKRNHSKARFLKPSRFFLSRARRSNDSKGFHCAKQQRSGTICLFHNRPKSSFKKSSQEKNFECVHKRPASNSLLRIASNNTRSIDIVNAKVRGSTKALKSYRGINVDESVATKETRSYAEIIAVYTEKMYAQSNLGILKKGLNMAMINEIHKSPFSTVSMMSLMLKNKDKVTKRASLWSVGALHQNVNFSSGASATSYDCRRNAFEGGDEFERMLSLYAIMIEKYSNTLNHGVEAHGIEARGCGNNLVPRRNVSTKLYDASMVLSRKARDVDGKSSPEESSSKDLVESESANLEEQNEIGWMTKVEDVIKDLKHVTAKKEKIDEKTVERWALQSVNERAHWLDRVVSAHKKRIESRKSESEKVAVDAKPNESIEFKEATLEKNSMPSGLEVDRDPTARIHEITARDKPSNPISEYIKRSPVNSNKPTKSSSQSSTTVTANPAKEPQIELRMTPSQNESVVSINVDDLTAKTTGTRDQLSVVISSKRSKVATMDSNERRSDFGSMQISISENTVPVKQIEFSINGKPVSELKSIVARSDKLDVVSSMDKVEIRIPSSKKSISAEQAQSLVKPATTPVLNLQIAAKFNEPRSQQPEDTGPKMTTTTPSKPTPSKPTKPHHLFVSPKSPKNDTNSRNISNAKRSENTAGAKQADTVPKFNSSASIPKQQMSHSSSSIAKTNNIPLEDSNSNANAPPANPSEQSPLNVENLDEPTLNRVPSNIIPWWSSEKSFKKIKKKKNISRNASKLIDDESGLDQSAENDSAVQNTTKSVDASRSGLAKKSKTARRSATDEKGKNLEHPDSDFRIVRVRSQPRWVSFKPTSGIKLPKHMKVNSVTNAGKIGKKMRYCVKSDIAKKDVVVRQKCVTPFSSTPRTPKVVPTKATAKNQPEGTKASSPSAKKNVSEQQVTAANVDASKIEKESKVDTKAKKPVIPHGSTAQASKTNVQHSKTIYKETDLKKPANRSAGVSAKSSSEFAKGVEKDNVEGTVEDDLSRGSKTVDESSDQKFKKVMKSIKPIEKREDGTLIDYGVTVPSRTSLGKSMQTSRILRDTSTKIDANKVADVTTAKPKDTSNQPEIAEPKTILSVKKESSREPKSVIDRAKIVESEKVLLVKKEVKEPKNVPTQEKIVEAEKVSSVKKKTLTEPKGVLDEVKIVEAEYASSVKKPNGPKLKAQSPKVQVIDSQKQKELTSRKPESEINTRTIRSPNRIQVEKRATSAKASLIKPPPVKPTSSSLKTSNSMNDIKSKVSEKTTSHPLEGTIAPSPSYFSRKQESKVNLKTRENLGKAPFEGTIGHSARVTDKKLASVDNASLKESSARKNSNSSKVLPRKETTKDCSKNQDNLETLINTSNQKGKKSKLDAEEEVDVFLNLNVTKTPSNKGGGNSGVPSIPTGPAGLILPRSSPITQVSNDETAIQYSSQGGRGETCKQKSEGLMSSNEECSQEYVSFSSNEPRAEKDILYASWLRRFNKLDDDKVG